ncbi:MAG: metalloregulator ArsR/SmtB family transcription factor [Planctomycetota bacterium]|nr:metalloregulator ArsR/SmtB family transcription factor [Planctomycetota bacterium]
MATDALSMTLSALADPTRRGILATLARGAATVKELAAPFDLSPPTISKHLKVLERAGLIQRGRKAQWRPCALRPERLHEAAEWIDRLQQSMEANYTRLDAVLEELNAVESNRKPTSEND